MDIYTQTKRSVAFRNGILKTANSLDSSCVQITDRV